MAFESIVYYMHCYLTFSYWLKDRMLELFELVQLVADFLIEYRTLHFGSTVFHG